MSRWLSCLIVAGLWVSLSACGAQKTDAEARGDRPVVLFNITSGPDDAHPVTMALQLAGHALDDGREVVLFFNVKGVSIPTKDLPADLAYHDKPIAGLLDGLIDRGATALACPHCMKAEGITAEDLVEGVQVASREKVFGPLGARSVVFTY